MNIIFYLVCCITAEGFLIHSEAHILKEPENKAAKSIKNKILNNPRVNNGSIAGGN